MEFDKSLRPKVGIGVCIIKDGKLLLTLRSSEHANGTWCAPGGHLEGGESFLDCCRREVKEEVGLDVGSVEILATVNNIFSPEKHYVSLEFLAHNVTGTLVNGEPEKIAEIGWFAIDNLPSPLMLAQQNLFAQYPEVLNKLRQADSFK